MLSTTKIDFYIDDQNQAIPAAIAASYLGDGIFFEELPVEICSLQLDDEPQGHRSNWLGIATSLAGVVSLGAVWLANQPGLTFPFAASNDHLAETGHFSAIQSQGTTASATSPVAAPESMARPIFSNQTQSVKPTSAQAAVKANWLQQAQSLSRKALVLSKNAQSIDDWRLVASQWQKAVTALASIPRGHADYAVAQQRLTKYRPALQAVQRKANQPILEAPLPITTVYRPEPKQDPEKTDQPKDSMPIAAASRPDLQGTSQTADRPVTGASVPTAPVPRPDLQEGQPQANQLVVKVSVPTQAVGQKATQPVLKP